MQHTERAKRSLSILCSTDYSWYVQTAMTNNDHDRCDICHLNLIARAVQHYYFARNHGLEHVQVIFVSSAVNVRVNGKHSGEACIV